MKRLVLSLASVLLPLRLSAQLVYGPGDLVSLTTPMTFTASLSCQPDASYFLGGTSCLNTANGVLLLRQGAWADVSFNGASGPVTFRNEGVPRTTLGTLHVATGGTGPFGWPEFGPQTGMFFMRLSFDGATPGNFLETFSSGFIRQSSSAVAMYAGRTTLYTPYGANKYSAIIDDVRASGPLLAQNDFDVTVTGQFSLVPEPSTWALVAFGAIPLGLLAGYRRRKS